MHHRLRQLFTECVTWCNISNSKFIGTNYMPRLYEDAVRETKTKTLEELAEILQGLKVQGKKIVHCHGVFDLLHIGHIRHFQEARKSGDLLVVTVTPDRFVNKGPHRPAFPENLRLEALSALEMIDYVALNRTPMAVEAIKLLKPHFYAKGPDYKHAEKDHTGGISLEEEAVRSVGGELLITEDITFSASSLINRHLSSFPKEVSEWVLDFSTRYTSDDILSYLKSAHSLKVLVVGEAIIDEYQYGEAIGKSSKEPMLAVKRTSTEMFPGGSLAVANHIANFVDYVGLLSFLGEQNTQEEFIREKLNPKIHPKFLYRKDSPTIVKRRFIESYFFTKLMEIYEINDSLLDSRDNRALCETLEEILPLYDLVIVMDFGHGMMTPEAIRILADKAPFLAVNAQSNAGNVGYQSLTKYPRADYVCMAENEIRMETRDRRGDLKEMVLELSKKRSYERITVTRGSSGCLAWSKSEGFFEIPALAGKVIDRMGAGDSFLSLTALCVAQKAPAEVAGFIGNVVGAQAVATVGHRKSIERAPLFKHIESVLK